MRVIFEAGTRANWIYRLIERLGHEPLMANTRRLARITASLSKDDRTDVKRLRHSRNAGARMGLRPKRRDSRERSPELSITKSGDRMLRQLLVQCAQHILGRHGEDPALRRWGLRLATRGGKAAKRKAVVAVARKLSVLLHVLWKSDTDFDPFYGASRR